MTAKPLVSVIVTTFNRRALISETLDSILGQSYTNLEVIVVDNESNDGTEEHIRSVKDTRIKYLRHANGGVIAVNRNYGIERASGDYVAFCDDDDLWMPNKIALQVEAFSRHPGTAVIGTNLILFSREAIYGRAFSGATLSERRPILMLLAGSKVALSSTLVRRRALLDARGFDENPAAFGVEDFSLWLRISLGGGRIRILHEPLVRYRMHPGQFSARDRRVTIRKLDHALKDLRIREVVNAPFYYLGRACLFFQLAEASLREPIKKLPGARELKYKLKALFGKLGKE